MRLSQGELVSLYVVIAATLPAAYAGASGALQSFFHFFAADAFIYLSVADTSRFGFYTFDGINATSGFHPLWQILLQGAFQTFGLTGDKVAQITFAFWASVTLVTTGSVFTALTVLRWSGSALAAMLTVPGLFGIAMMLCGWQLGAVWHFMNGMESPLSLFFFGLMVFYLSAANTKPLLVQSRPNRQHLLMLSILSIGILFSRLDDVFLPVVVGAWLLLQPGAPFKFRMRNAMWFGIPLLTAVAAYLTFNYYVNGHPFPVSGYSKFSLDAIRKNTIFLVISVLSLVPGYFLHLFELDQSLLNFSFSNWRNAQMILPAVIASIVLLVNFLLPHRATAAIPIWMRLLLFYVILKSTYNYLFVPLINQGHWYYAVSITIINMICAVMLARLLEKWRQRGTVVAKVIIPAVAATALASMIAFFHTPGPVTIYHELFKRGPAIAKSLAKHVPNPKIIEADDGIVSYSVGLPAISGFMFAIDRKAYAAFKHDRFLSEAWSRGYNLIGSLYYLRRVDPDNLTPEKIPGILPKRLFSAAHWDIDKFEFSLAYRDKKTGATFIRFEPKD